MIRILEDLLCLFYPDVCYTCGTSLSKSEKILCAGCYHHLPRTRFHDDPENPVVRSFWGRVNIRSATSYLYFRRGGITQKLLHRFKYRGEKEIGTYLGREFGDELANSNSFSNIDVIIPVPLHPKKQRKRGFNQSLVIARGASDRLNAEVYANTVVRRVHTSTQTRKGRYERWANVENIFELRESERLSGKHVLVIDDVITTGATMEACLHALSPVDDIKLYAGSVAFSSK